MGSNKLLLGALAAAILVAGVYFVFLRDDEASGPALTTEGGAESMTASAQADREFLHLLQELNAIQLNPELFNNPIFRSLENFHVEPTQQPVGRENPFAPAGR